MEHIIQFGVTIDDDSIKKHVEEKATEAVVKEIRSELGFSTSYYSNENVVRKLVAIEVEKQFEKLQDAIIEATAEKLTEKLSRTKKVKDATQKVLDAVLG